MGVERQRHAQCLGVEIDRCAQVKLRMFLSRSRERTAYALITVLDIVSRGCPSGTGGRPRPNRVTILLTPVEQAANLFHRRKALPINACLCRMSSAALCTPPPCPPRHGTPFPQGAVIARHVSALTTVDGAGPPGPHADGAPALRLVRRQCAGAAPRMRESPHGVQRRPVGHGERTDGRAVSTPRESATRRDGPTCILFAPAVPVSPLALGHPDTHRTRTGSRSPSGAIAACHTGGRDATWHGPQASGAVLAQTGHPWTWVTR